MSRVLIVEDQMIIAYHLESLLKSHGLKVLDKIKNGNQAVEAAKNQNPDILFIDIMLADDTSGLDAANAIRKFSDAPIIFMTALTDQTTMQEVEKIENSYLINKPFKQETLIETINHLTEVT